MATASLSLRLCLPFSSSRCFNRREIYRCSLSFPSPPLYTALKPGGHPAFFSKNGRDNRSHHLVRRSSEGVSSNLVEDSKFVPLNADDPVYGPPGGNMVNLSNPSQGTSIASSGHDPSNPIEVTNATNASPEPELEDNTANLRSLEWDDPWNGMNLALLLLGFEADETSKIKKFLKELDGEFLKVIHCTEDMLTRSVWDAMHTEQPNLEAMKIARSLPRICFLSGLSGEEMMMFIDAFPETGLEPAVFAALVPNSADKLVKDVAEEIMGDHEMLSAREPN